MKIKSSLLVLALVAGCALISQTTQARQNGTLPEDNGSVVADDNGGLQPNTNSVSNSGSGKKNGNGNKVIETKIKLVAAPEFTGAKGTARSRVSAKKQDFQVEIQVAKKLSGSMVGVTVGDTVIGTITINAGGKGKLELSTEHGDVVPVIAPGTLIAVVDGLGAPILAGQF